MPSSPSVGEKNKGTDIFNKLSLTLNIPKIYLSPISVLGDPHKGQRFEESQWSRLCNTLSGISKIFITIPRGELLLAAASLKSE